MVANLGWFRSKLLCSWVLCFGRWTVYKQISPMADVGSFSFPVFTLWFPGSVAEMCIHSIKEAHMHKKLRGDVFFVHSLKTLTMVFRRHLQWFWMKMRRVDPFLHSSCCNLIAHILLEEYILKYFRSKYWLTEYFSEAQSSQCSLLGMCRDRFLIRFVTAN